MPGTTAGVRPPCWRRATRRWQRAAVYAWVGLWQSAIAAARLQHAGISVAARELHDAAR